MTHDLKIRVISCCKNEEKILPFFLQYYSKFVDEIVIYEGGSTDHSVEIISKCPKARIVSTGNNEKIDDKFLTDVRNNAIKDGGDNWDWQIIVDVDEFIYHPQLMEKLSEYKIKGVTVPLIIGYDMMSLHFPEYNLNKTIIDQIKTGVTNKFLFKKAVVNSKEVNIAYWIGCHNCELEGNIVYSDFELMLLHYRWLSYDYFINKNITLSGRLSDYNKENDFGIHTSILSKISEVQYNEEVSKAYDISNPILNLDNCDKLPYPSESVFQMRANNILESVNYWEAHNVIKEWNRVLVKGGRLVIETQDFLLLCLKFVNADEKGRINLYSSFFGPSSEEPVKFLYTSNQLTWTLQAEGFSNIWIKNNGNNLIAECYKI